MTRPPTDGRPLERFARAYRSRKIRLRLSCKDLEDILRLVEHAGLDPLACRIGRLVEAWHRQHDIHDRR